ncbi:MAG: FAD-binding oxidoreductase, partial [Proteobacteria bacterium]|nr:FAD-binding oxidoreductase [Pseudomonadota bacterium]
KEVFTDILRISKARGMVSYLGVMKRYREDDFLMSHALDGFSMALDYPVTRDNKAALWQMTQEFSDMVIEAGGLFYPAKDLVIRPDQFQRAWGQERVTAFRTLRNRCDPQKILRTDLSARYGLDE